MTGGVRALGIVGLLGSPGLLITWLVGGFDNPDPPRAAVVSQLAFLVGWCCSLLALRRLHAAGHGRGQILLAVQLAGVVLASTQELQDLLLGKAGRVENLYNVADAAWPVSVLLMIVTGRAIMRGGVLTGWRRFPAIACGLALPVATAAGFLAGGPAVGPAFGLITTVAWGALALSTLNS
jgi:hypothetical protein